MVVLDFGPCSDMLNNEGGEKVDLSLSPQESRYVYAVYAQSANALVQESNLPQALTFWGHQMNKQQGRTLRTVLHFNSLLIPDICICSFSLAFVPDDFSHRIFEISEIWSRPVIIIQPRLCSQA